jgi:hypothetical protein
MIEDAPLDAEKAAGKATGRPFEKGDKRINRTRPGPGRPPDKIRAALRKAFDDRRSILEGIADDPETDNVTRMKALDMLAKYGLGTPTAAVDSEGNQTDIPLVTFKPA